jgi:hypothetical protein
MESVHQVGFCGGYKSGVVELIYLCATASGTYGGSISLCRGKLVGLHGT